MGIEENKKLIYKLYEEYNKGNYDFFDECVTDDFVSTRHDGSTQNKETYKQVLLTIKNMFPDIQRTIEDLVVTDDRAAVYFTWTGTDTVGSNVRKPTGKEIKVKEFYFLRFKDGKISDYRQYGDPHSMRYQLGMLVDADTTHD